MTMEKTTLPPRSEIPEKYTWNAPSVFQSKADWEAACDTIMAELPELRGYQGKLSENPGTLADFLAVFERNFRLLGKILSYGNMSYSVDTTDQGAASMADRARGLFGQFRAATAFLDPELLQIGGETLAQWMDTEPRLAFMRHYVDNLFRRQAHVRSAEVEQVMGLTSEPMGAVSNIFAMLNNADLKFKPAVGSDGTEYPVAQGTYHTLMSNPDREVRRSAYESYNDGYLAYKNTFAATLMTSVKQDVFQMRVRGYDSCLEASLFENNIPVEVFHNLINTFKKNIPTWHKYWAVRRKVLGLDALQPFDIWAPIADKVHVSYEQAVDWVSEGMKPLGEDYVAALRQGCLEDRWVDVYPNVGKRNGAFSDGMHDTFPFIMMSHDDSMGGFSTLAHELGHSMHSYLSRKNQPVWYSRYSLFVAEVASNFNQAMSRAYLREAKADDANFQIALIEEAMGNFHRYFFIMPTLARFELEVHTRAEKGQSMTATDLIALMTELFQEGYGDEMRVDHDRVGITWATFPHLYSAFYVYQYATGISAAHALADQVLNGDGAQRYMEFLSAGGSIYPLDALNHAGVDMTQPDAVETTFGVLSDMVNRLEQLTQ